MEAKGTGGHAPLPPPPDFADMEKRTKTEINLLAVALQVFGPSVAFVTYYVLRLMISAFSF